jgi:hypothetical protein
VNRYKHLVCQAKAFSLRFCQQEDKQKHFVCSLVLLLLLSYFFSAETALVLTFFIGFGKEVYDHFYGSGFCWFDMFANALGVAFALLLIK